MSKNVNVGAGRQSHTTPDGTYLERRYMYLSPALWQSAHSLSKAADMSASQYIAQLLTAAADGQPHKENHATRSR